MDLRWVGWMPYTSIEREKSSDLFKSKLFQYCRFSQDKVRCVAECPICKHRIFEYRLANESFEIMKSVIWVYDQKLKVYIAPIEIFHLVNDHDYLPPEQFIDAVLTVIQNGKHLMAQLSFLLVGLKYRIFG